MGCLKRVQEFGLTDRTDMRSSDIITAIAICFDELIEAIDRNTESVKDIADQGNSEMGFNVTLFGERA